MKPADLRALHADALALVTAARADDSEGMALVLRDYTGEGGGPGIVELISALAKQVVSLAERAGSIHGMSGERYLCMLATAVAAE